MAFLNENILDEFSIVLQSSPVFQHKYKEHYDLLCVVRDRLDTCVKYLNSHDIHPKSEEDFLAFMMFACMTTDAVKQMLKDINAEYKDSYTIFQFVFENSELFPDKSKFDSDNKFFEYFRSLTFAHPYETSRAKFLQKGEIQYSPWVITNNLAIFHIYKEESVGVRVYTNKSPDIFNLVIPFRILKDYISERYEQLSEVTAWMKQDIEEINKVWKEQKIDLSLPPKDIVKQMIDILELRHDDPYWLKRYYDYYNLELTDISNKKAVDEFLDAFSELLPVLKEKIENLDDEGLYETFYQFEKLGQPKWGTQEHYQLEKIFGELNHIVPGQMCHDLFQAKYFSEGFASKWVNIDVYSMPVREIQLLANVACYMNYKYSDKQEVNL